MKDQWIIQRAREGQHESWATRCIIEFGAKNARSRARASIFIHMRAAAWSSEPKATCRLQTNTWHVCHMSLDSQSLVRSNLYDEKVMQTSETFLCLVSFFGFVGHMSSKSRQSKEEERTAGEVVPPAVRSSSFYTFVWANRFDSVWRHAGARCRSSLACRGCFPRWSKPKGKRLLFQG